MSASVGADIESLCAKCGDVWHVVVAKEGDKIAKVQCKQCGGYHRYKSVHGASAEDKKPSNLRAAKAPAAPRSPVERFEKPAVAADLDKPVRTYRASERFEVGERVDHPSFGQGVIELSEPGKITVFFATGRRVLVQAKGDAPKALERPKPFDHSRPPAGGKPVGEQ
jgi:predicted  nucleic acid-binding Zn-ribbon protein